MDPAIAVKKIQAEITYRITRQLNYSNRENRYELRGYEWVAAIYIGTVHVWTANLETLRHMGLTQIAFELELQQSTENSET